jgi:hypothetical protein
MTGAGFSGGGATREVSVGAASIVRSTTVAAIDLSLIVAADEL